MTGGLQAGLWHDLRARDDPTAAVRIEQEEAAECPGREGPTQASRVQSVLDRQDVQRSWV